MAAFLLGGVGAAEAAAATGELTQKPGTAGCVSETGTLGACDNGKALVDASSVAVSPDGSSAYVASSTSDAVAVLDRAADGTLTPKSSEGAGCISDTGAGLCVDGRALDGAFAVAVSPDGKNVYVASFGSDAVAVFDRRADGKLTQKSGPAGCISQTGADSCAVGIALDGAFSVAVSADGSNVYVASPTSDAVAVFDRDVADGTLHQRPRREGCVSETVASPCAIGTALAGAESVTVSPDGKSVYVASFNSDAVAVFDRGPGGTLNQTGCISQTGADLCAVGIALDGAFSVAVSPDGASAYVASFNSDAVAVFDRAADGTLTQKPGEAGCISQTPDPCAGGTALDGAASVTVSPDGRSAYIAARPSDAVAIFDREPLPPPLPTPAPAPPPAPLPPSPVPADTTRPLLSDLSLSPSRFRAAASGPSIAARGGSRVSYTLSEPAAVRFRVERALAGRRVGGRCVKPTRSNRRARRCTRYRTLRGRFTHKGVTGANKFRFTGRLRGRRLRPGRYRLRAVATDPAGNRSRPQRSRFRIVRR